MSEDKNTDQSTPYQDALDVLNGHDGYRYEAVKYLIKRMGYSDTTIITDYCISREREIRRLRK